ncbi:hypothetical protein D9619_010551 [Psilocybe cf. subviscida]|uniref:Uncharacterized protein n=1 Tax=Psilocybe cf. subviscida TaxID=2480587 RepID=A0A8H5ASW2_9AGAR|nr:hypothetical protein D9619_010551 [Psilocybe cf. subviscida]
MPGFEEVPAQIVGLWMETLFYGIYLVTFVLCIQVLLWDSAHARFKHPGTWNRPLLVAALLMFIFGTLDVALGLQHNLKAFWFGIQSGQIQGPADEFARISEWVNVMKLANYDAQTFIGDGILLYRCYMIYNRKWLVILVPGLLWLGTLAFSIVTIVIEATLGTGVLNQSQLKPFITGTLSMTLAMNVITTSLMVYRIWNIQQRTNRRLSRLSGIDPYSRVLRVLIECGAIYTVSVIILFVCYLANNNAQLPVSDSIVQIIGITFNLIIINVGRGQHTRPTDSDFSTNYVISMPSHSHRSGHGTSSNTLPLQSINVKTESTVVRDASVKIIEESEDQKKAKVRDPESLTTHGNDQGSLGRNWAAKKPMDADSWPS